VNTGAFTALLPTAAGAAGPNNDGTLNVSLHDTVVFSYVDQLDAAGNSVLRTDIGGLGLDSDGVDEDSDNDGIPNSAESAGDADGDGVDNFLDIDSDNDGLTDDLEGLNDFDNNGVPDYLESRGQLETAVRGVGGGGSFGVAGLFALALLVLLIRRRNAAALMPAFILVIVFSQLPTTQAVADGLCAHFTDPADERLYYDGDDPEADGAVYRTCWYGGAGLGYSYVAPEKEANNFLLNSGEDHDNGWHLLIGKQIDRHWFAEFKYADLGEAGITNRNPAVAAAFPNAAIAYQVPSLLAGYQWHIGRKWIPFAKFGIAAINNDTSGGPVPFDKQTSIQLAFGGGLRFDFGRGPWFLRGDVDWYDRDAWYAGITVGFEFGDEAKERPMILPPADSDADGVLDGQDRCMNSRSGVTVDASGCEVELDNDVDGVADSADACPNTRLGVVVDARGCNRDNDADGVFSSVDQCPMTLTGATVDAVGCEVQAEIELPDVRFESDSDQLIGGSENVLDGAARTLIDNPNLIVEVAGYTDSSGNADYNRDLSERRARAVMDYLIDEGVDADSVTARGYGEEDAIADNTTVDGRALNRRVIVRVVSR